MSKIARVTIYLSLVFFLSLSACREQQKKVVQPIKIEFRQDGELKIFDPETDSLKAAFRIEVADDEYERQRGLMDRRSMGNDEGMLFIFPDSNLRSFYMKSTYIPLDIIYAGSGMNIVSFQKNAKPLDETSLPSNFPAKYVFEINGGLSDQLNLKVGDSIAFSLN